MILTLKPPEGYSVEREGAHAVALDLTLDEDLRREGHAREIVHAIQNARKAAGLQVEDRIELELDGDTALLEAVDAHREYLSGETLALELTLGADGLDGADGLSGARRTDGAAGRSAADGTSAYREQTEVDGLELSIALRRCQPAAG